MHEYGIGFPSYPGWNGTIGLCNLSFKIDYIIKLCNLNFLYQLHIHLLFLGLV